MSKYLVVFSKDWADEFDCQRYKIFDSLEQAISAKSYLIENGGYFGTNEGFEEGELSPVDFKIKEIADQEAEILKNLLGNSFGTGVI